MLVTLEKNRFLKIIQNTQKALLNRNTLPVLKGIFLEAKNNTLIARATDLEISIMNNTKARVEKEGSAVVLGELLLGLIKNLEDGKIKLFFDQKENKINIRSATSKFILNTLPVEDFPSFPVLNSKKIVRIKNEEFIGVVHQAAISASKDESRPTLTGIYLDVKEKNMRLVSTDSYRLSLRKIKTINSQEEKTIIPKRAIEAALGASSKEGETEIIFSQKQVGFKGKDFLLISRLIGGEYPNFMQLFPKKFKTDVHIKKEEFIRAVKRVALVSSGSPITLTIKNKKITIRGKGANTGAGEEEPPATINGENAEVSFNSKYLIEGLEAIEGEEATMFFNDSFQPGLISENKTKNFKYLIMPVRQDTAP